MIVLAIETSTDTAGIALWREGSVLAEAMVRDRRELAARLAAAIERLLADAGVSIEVGDAFVRQIQRHLRRTYGPRVVEMPKGFAGLFRLDHDRKLFAKNFLFQRYPRM